MRDNPESPLNWVYGRPGPLNVPLLRKAVEWVEAESQRGPESEWVQAHWYSEKKSSCGTAYCVAGYVAQLDGARFDWDAGGKLFHPETGARMSVSEYAREKLGLSPREAGELFCGTNSAVTIRRFAERFAREKL